MYTFVRIRKKYSTEYGTWYFKPSSREDIDMHFRTIVGKYIHEGFQKDGMDGVYYSPTGIPFRRHPITEFGDAVIVTQAVFEQAKGTPISWLEAAFRVEKDMYDSRISLFEKHDIYLPDGLSAYVIVDNSEIVETREQESLIYPANRDISIDDFVFPEDDGRYYSYLKIRGETDSKSRILVTDKKGNVKFNTLKEAIEAAREFISEYSEL